MDNSKHQSFKSYLSKLDIKNNIKFFELIMTDKYSTWVHYFMELDESIINELNKYEIDIQKIIVPITNSYLTMYYFDIYSECNPIFGIYTQKANQYYFINYLRQKNVLKIIKPNLNKGLDAYDLINQLVKNQDHYSNEMKKKIITEEFNNIQKYNYEEIKQKNKQLNQEFKRIAKLMKLNIMKD